MGSYKKVQVKKLLSLNASSNALTAKGIGILLASRAWHSADMSHNSLLRFDFSGLQTCKDALVEKCSPNLVSLCLAHSRIRCRSLAILVDGLSRALKNNKQTYRVFNTCGTNF